MTIVLSNVGTSSTEAAGVTLTPSSTTSFSLIKSPVSPGARSVDQSGNVKSPSTPEWGKVRLAHGTPTATSTIPVTQAPPYPPEIDSAIAGYKQVVLTWEPDLTYPVKSYNLYRSTSAGGEGTRPYLTGLTGTQHIDAGLKNGTTYYYTLTAVGSGGESQQSDESSNTPFASTPTFPNPPMINGGRSTVVTGTSTTASVTVVDDGPASGVIYKWSAAGPGAVTFSPNGTNAASTAMATFSEAGAYTLTCTATDSDTLSDSSDTQVCVTSTPTKLVILPSKVTVAYGKSWYFRSQERDQFNNEMSPATGPVWTLTSGTRTLSRSKAGLFRAPLVPEIDIIKCTADGLTSSATVTVGAPDTKKITLPFWTDLRNVTANTARHSGKETLSVTTGAWQPDGVSVGDHIYGYVSATLRPSSLDPGDGTGPTYVTYDWTNGGVWESLDGKSGDFVPYNGNYVMGWQEGFSKTQFNAEIPDAGFFIWKVNCTATVHSSADGRPIRTLYATGYIGGESTDLARSR